MITKFFNKKRRKHYNIHFPERDKGKEQFENEKNL
jgi:hypothetical protein